MILFLSMLESPEEQNTVESLYLKWLPKFMKTAYDIMGNEADAHDMVINALMRLMNKYQHYFEYAHRSEPMLMGLTVKFIRQECSDELARRAKQCIEVVYLEEDRAAAERDGSFVPGFEDDFVRLAALRTALKNLPERDQVLVDSYYIMKYSREETGQIVGLRVEGVKSRLNSILRKLKYELTEVACRG